MDYKCYKIYELEAQEILKGLRLAECMNAHDLENSPKIDENAVLYNLKELNISDVLTCSYCNVSFVDAFDQRNHFKLDWHRYNLKRALCGHSPVSEEIFLTLADDISSISGSDSEGYSEDSDNDFIIQENLSDNKSIDTRLKVNRHSKVFFENENNQILSIYKCLLQGKKESLLKDNLINVALDLINKPKKWLIVMLGGGHFAAAIVDNGKIIHHKTFHSYTVRAKQGGSQSSRDNRGSGHAKSAGASLRRYNEQTLVQHVQEIISNWSEQLKHCNLILYRATGPYNRSILFGGKNPPLTKTDVRLRSIPFPTKRATFKEVLRVNDILSNIEIYGSADDFKNKFPKSPDKRIVSTKSSADLVTVTDSVSVSESLSPNVNTSKSKLKKKDALPKDEPEEKYPNASEASDSDEENEIELTWDESTISFDHLQEYEDSIPQSLKDRQISSSDVKKKRKKLGTKERSKLKRKQWNEEFFRIQKSLIESCKNRDKESFVTTLKLYDSLPERTPNESEQKKPSAKFTKEDFIDCLNSAAEEETKHTLLHIASTESLPEFVTLLLSAGADPTVKNKNKLTPYVMAKDKDTKNSFKLFVASFPHKYDLKQANIPEPLTEEMEREKQEKKKEKRKLKREKDKITKQENRKKRIEYEDKQKFLALSDREKCALAADRRLMAKFTANVPSAVPPVLARCFQCGLDITGKVPFEYGINRFCSIPCLKAHRAKTNSYGLDI